MSTELFFTAEAQRRRGKTARVIPLRLCASVVIFFVLLTSCSGDSKAPQPDAPPPSQLADPCTVIPNKIMNPNASDTVMSSDFGYLISCGLLDSFDLRYIVPHLIPEVLADQVQAGNDSITYRLVIEKVKEFHATKGYAEMKARLHTLDSMRAAVIDPNHWQPDTMLLMSLGMEKESIAHLHRIVKQLQKKNKNVTWAQALDSTDNFLSHLPPR